MFSIYTKDNARNYIESLYAEKLSDKKYTTELRKIQTSIGEIAYLENGISSEKLPLILLHGANSNSLCWLHDIEMYKMYFHVFAIDLPGDPGLSDEIRLPFNTDDYESLFSEIISKLNIRKFNLLGLSQGGYIAARFAAYKPDMVEKLILINPGGICNPKFKFILNALMLPITKKRGQLKLLQMTFGDQRIPQEVIDMMEFIMANVKPRLDKQTLITDIMLGNISARTLMIGGKHDQIIPSEKVKQRLQSKVKNIQTEILDSGHVLPDITEIVIEFLNE